ncbi:MAG: helix-turn-helix domain-containing protein [Clostridiales bacterium]|nr:helix-turn-helix domain-containing protein [Clostridiales bacterium]
METGLLRFLEMLAQSRPLEDLLKYAGEILHNPIMLVDHKFSFMSASSLEKRGDQMWDDALDNTATKQQYTEAGFTATIMHEVLFSDKPVMTNFMQKYQRIMAKVGIGSHSYGVLIVLECEPKFDDDTLNNFKYIIDALAIELQRMQMPFLSTTDSAEKILQTILLEKKTPAWISAQYLYPTLGYIKKDNSFYIVYVPVQANEFNEKQFRYIQTQSTTVTAATISCNLGSAIVLLFSSSKDEYPGIYHWISSTMKTYKLRGGISKPFKDLEEIRDYCMQAQRAVDIGATLMDDVVVPYEKAELYDLLNGIPYERLCAYHADILKPVLDMDKEQNIPYTQTLQVYLEHCGNLTAASKALFIHRNTVIHRMEKIQEVLGMDLTSGEVCTKLMIAIKIHELFRDTL